ncbi:hypothetical protein [Croceicoccus gelatinilyticus]|nr:hypothetical protein [Croceicoccus gelatinilyticus]
MAPPVENISVETDTFLERSTDAALLIVLFAGKAAIALGFINFTL